MNEDAGWTVRSGDCAHHNSRQERVRRTCTLFHRKKRTALDRQTDRQDTTGSGRERRRESFGSSSCYERRLPKRGGGGKLAISIFNRFPNHRCIPRQRLSLPFGRVALVVWFVTVRSRRLRLFLLPTEIELHVCCHPGPATLTIDVPACSSVFRKTLEYLRLFTCGRDVRLLTHPGCARLYDRDRKSP